MTRTITPDPNDPSGNWDIVEVTDEPDPGWYIERIASRQAPVRTVVQELGPYPSMKSAGMHITNARRGFLGSRGEFNGNRPGQTPGPGPQQGGG